MKALLFDLIGLPLWVIAQADGADAGAADGAPTGAPSSSLITQILGNPLNLILISGILFILLVLRPQQRQMKEHQTRLAGLKKNDRVVTSSGIHGTVVQASADEPVVILRVDDNSGARLTVNREAIAKIVVEEKEKTKE
jgi:preprotein translocase subunit YajC